ncbi:MAG: methyltransferase domain-containing protein [Eubacteriales bacterium]|nr:methyltransferase domain-containing protein [Eubacteriales bacterium]
MKNLIFIEGVSGVGKSTTTPKLCKQLLDKGYSAAYYLEGDVQSPIDSFWNAFLTKTEYENIRHTYPEYMDELSENSIVFSDQVLVQYQDFMRRYYSPELYEYLKEHEFCYNPANPLPLEKYTKVFSDLWRRFAESEQKGNHYIILDGSFLHHQINDLIRNYNVSEGDIINHLSELLQTVQSLNPIVFYFASQDVGERLSKAWDNRKKSAPTDEDIAYWKNRKEMDLRILLKLPVEAYILDISNEDWDSALDMIYLRISKNDPMITHYDALIDEINDPVRDPEPLKAYMDKWDGNAFIDALQLAPDKSVLEIGVGTGRLAVKVCGKCGSFTGIDISPKTMKRAKENLSNFDNTKLICGDFINHHFDENFDVIYSSLTFMHIRNKQAAIQKAADLLKSGGRFVLSISKDQQNIIDYGYRQIEVYPDIPKEIASLLIRAGLMIEKQFETDFAIVFAATKGAIK